MIGRLYYCLFYTAICLILPLMLPVQSAGASPPIKLWSNGNIRQVGPVEVTGLPGRDYYRQIGDWTYWYRNGRIRKKGSFTEGTASGWWEYWYDNGIRKREGAYDKEGKEVGAWKYWYDNGLPRKEGTYREGLPDGHWKFYYNQVENPLQKEGNFIKGEEDGHWIYLYKNGLRKQEGSYIHGMEEGPWKYWYENGDIKSEGSYRYGVETGGWIYWDRTGEGDDKKAEELTYTYTEIIPSNIPRQFSRPGMALNGHWLSRKVLANFRMPQTRIENIHHIYLDNEDKLIEVIDGGFIEATYTVEKESSEKRTVQFRVTRDNGKGAVLFAIFSKDYRKLAGMYYLVDFLRGSRGRSINYFIMEYAGTDPGPVLK